MKQFPPLRKALASAQQSASRADKGARHCVGGAERRAAMRRSADELEAHAKALERAIADVELLVAYARQARAALEQNATYPADLALARAALGEGLARFDPEPTKE